MGTNGLPLMDPKWKQIKEMDQATWLKHNNPEKVAKHDPQGINLKKEIALLDREISVMEKHIAINGHGPKETKELKKLRHRSEVLAHLLKWVQTGTKPPNMTDTHSTNEGSRAKERIDCKSTAHLKILMPVGMKPMPVEMKPMQVGIQKTRHLTTMVKRKVVKKAKVGKIKKALKKTV